MRREQRPVKIFIRFVTTVKSHHSLTIWKKLFVQFLRVPKTSYEFWRVNMVWGGAVRLNITDVCMHFEEWFKVYNLDAVLSKSIELGQMATLNEIFHVVLSMNQLVKIWTRPSSLPNFWIAYSGIGIS